MGILFMFYRFRYNFKCVCYKVGKLPTWVRNIFKPYMLTFLKENIIKAICSLHKDDRIEEFKMSAQVNP